MCFLNQGLHIQLVMSTVLEKDGIFDPLDTLLLHVQGPSGLASSIPDLKHHQLEVSVKIKQPRNPGQFLEMQTQVQIGVDWTISAHSGSRNARSV